MKRPDPPSDKDIQEAFRALDGTLRDGQLDDFSSRVLARLDEPEASGMDSRELARGSGVSRPDEAALGGAVAEPARDEHSGLHEIKALASTTRRRISQKITSESEAEESLLVGASSGSFRAAALPDPAREKAEARERVSEPRPVARPASEVDRRPTPARTSSAPFWLLGGVATAAAAAAVAVFVFGIGRDKASDEAPASNVVARAETPAAPADQGAATGAPAEGTIRFAEPPPPPAAEPMGGAAADTAAPAASSPAPDSADDKAIARGDGEAGKGRAGGSATSKSEPAHRAEPAKEERPKETEKKAGNKADGKDLDDVLDQVAGKVEKPTAVEQAGPKKPSKKELDRGDVSRAMGAVRAAVMRCRDLEQFEGTVTVKFQVAPSGQVTSAEATGSKAGSPTGACVTAAVKKAKFPAFDGAPTSFTYPFLLAE